MRNSMKRLPNQPDETVGFHSPEKMPGPDLNMFIRLHLVPEQVQLLRHEWSVECLRMQIDLATDHVLANPLLDLIVQYHCYPSFYILVTGRYSKFFDQSQWNLWQMRTKQSQYAKDAPIQWGFNVCDLQFQRVNSMHEVLALQSTCPPHGFCRVFSCCLSSCTMILWNPM